MRKSSHVGADKKEKKSKGGMGRGTSGTQI